MGDDLTSQREGLCIKRKTHFPSPPKNHTSAAAVYSEEKLLLFLLLDSFRLYVPPNLVYCFESVAAEWCFKTFVKSKDPSVMFVDDIIILLRKFKFSNKSRVELHTTVCCVAVNGSHLHFLPIVGSRLLALCCLLRLRVLMVMMPYT